MDTRIQVIEDLISENEYLDEDDGWRPVEPDDFEAAEVGLLQAIPRLLELLTELGADEKRVGTLENLCEDHLRARETRQEAFDDWKEDRRPDSGYNTSLSREVRGFSIAELFEDL